MHKNITGKQAFGFGLLASAAVAAGCTGTIGGSLSGDPGDPSSMSPDPSDPGNSQAGQSGQPGQPGDPPPSIDPQKPVAPTAPATPSVAVAPISRLSNSELRNTLSDLFGADAVTSMELATSVEGASRVPISAAEGALLFSTAETIAGRVYKRSQVMLCTPSATVDRRTCTDKIVRDLGLRMFRRPMDDTEAKRYVDSAVASATFDDGIQAVVFAMLASPKFVYHVVRGDAARKVGNVVPLDNYEMASRLSYSLWQTMPTRELFDAAAQNKLSTLAQVTDRARTMLADPRARDATKRFHYWWLRMAETETLYRVPMEYPKFTSAVAKSWVAETQAFTDHVIFDGEGTLGEMFTANYSFVDPIAAPVYGVTTTQQLQRVTLPAERAGILTQPGFLATHAPSERTSPIIRGAFIDKHVLCAQLPNPPPNIPALPEADPNASLRDQITTLTGGAGCKVCHGGFNDLGFALGNFDAIGAYKTTDANGKPVDAAVTLKGPGDLDGLAASGPVEFAGLVAKSAVLRDCYVDTWFRYLLGRDIDPDADSYSRLKTQYDFEVSNRGVRDMLISMTSSDAFRFVPAAQ